VPWGDIAAYVRRRLQADYEQQASDLCTEVNAELDRAHLAEVAARKRVVELEGDVARLCAAYLELRRERLKDRGAGWAKRLVELEERAAAAEAAQGEVARLREALQIYGSHDPGCASHFLESPADDRVSKLPCDCGLAAALKEPT
jgi:hypothetical protein